MQRSPLFLLLIAIAIGILPTALAAQTRLTALTPGSDPNASSDELDPVEDLAGVLRPNAWDCSTGVLYTTAADLNGVLAALGATPSGSGSYTLEDHALVPSSSPDEAISNEVDSYDQPVSPTSFTVSIVSSLVTLAPPGPELVSCSKDTRTYKNAQCVQVLPGNSNPPCRLVDGTYTRIFTYPQSKCRRGSAFCTEARTLRWTLRTYMDNICRFAIQGGAQEGYDFSC